jgi:uncharacterized membrane protein YsdA (DUF1294 family)
MKEFLIFYFIIINLITIYIYKYDKTNAELNGPSKELKYTRISERTLHILSLLGGWPGALIAQQYFRHKTIKQPFQYIFIKSVVINTLLIGIFIFFAKPFNT